MIKFGSKIYPSKPLRMELTSGPCYKKIPPYGAEEVIYSSQIKKRLNS